MFSFNELHKLATSDTIADRLLCAEYDYTDPHLLTLLSTDVCADVVTAVAANKRTPPAVLESIVFPESNVKDTQPWRSFFLNNFTPEEVQLFSIALNNDTIAEELCSKLVEIGTSNKDFIRALPLLAYSDALTSTQIEHLWNYTDLCVYKDLVVHLATLPATPAPILDELYEKFIKQHKGHDWSIYDAVLQSLSANSSASPQVLYEIWTVATDLSGHEIRSAFVIRDNVRTNANTHPDFLRMLWQDSDNRACLAENPALPDDIAWKLAADQDIYIRSLLASNINTDTSILNFLVNDPDSSVRSNALENPNVDIYRFMESKDSIEYPEIFDLLCNPALSDELFLRFITSPEASSSEYRSHRVVDICVSHNLHRPEILNEFVDDWLNNSRLSFTQTAALLDAGVIFSQQSLLTFVELHGGGAANVITVTNTPIVSPLLTKVVSSYTNQEVSQVRDIKTPVSRFRSRTTNKNLSI